MTYYSCFVALISEQLTCTGNLNTKIRQAENAQIQQKHMFLLYNTGYIDKWRNSLRSNLLQSVGAHHKAVCHLYKISTVLSHLLYLHHGMQSRKFSQIFAVFHPISGRSQNKQHRCAKMWSLLWSIHCVPERPPKAFWDMFQKFRSIWSIPDSTKFSFFG